MYDSIEIMPIYNWIKILETGDFNYLFVDGEIVGDSYEGRWMDLQQDYIDEFGLDEEYKQQLRIMNKLNNLNVQFILTRDRSLLNSITILELDLKANENKKVVSFYEVLDYVEKHKGFAIDPRNTSVIKWYYSLKNMKNGKANKGE